MDTRECIGDRPLVSDFRNDRAVKRQLRVVVPNNRVKPPINKIGQFSRRNHHPAELERLWIVINILFNSIEILINTLCVVLPPCIS